MYWTVVRRSIISTRRTLCQDIRGTAKSGPSLKLVVWINGLTRSKQCKFYQSNKYCNQISEFLTESRCVKIFEAQTSLNHLVSDQFAENNAKLNRYWETLHPRGLRIGNRKTFDAFSLLDKYCHLAMLQFICSCWISLGCPVSRMCHQIIPVPSWCPISLPMIIWNVSEMLCVAKSESWSSEIFP